MVSRWEFVFRRFEISSSWLLLFIVRAFETFLSTSLPIYSLFTGRASFLLTNHEDVSLKFYICGYKNSLHFPVVPILARDQAYSTPTFWHILVSVERIMWAFFVPYGQVFPLFTLSWEYNETALSPPNKVLRKNWFLVSPDKRPWTLQNKVIFTILNN
jgi:hypothetical protein